MLLVTCPHITLNAGGGSPRPHNRALTTEPYLDFRLPAANDRVSRAQVCRQHSSGLRCCSSTRLHTPSAHTHTTSWLVELHLTVDDEGAGPHASQRQQQHHPQSTASMLAHMMPRQPPEMMHAPNSINLSGLNQGESRPSQETLHSLVVAAATASCIQQKQHISSQTAAATPARSLPWASPL
jgi:hypothetical protein